MYSKVDFFAYFRNAVRRMVKRGVRTETQNEERFAFKAESEALMDELYDAMDDDVSSFFIVSIAGTWAQLFKASVA